MTNKHCKRCGRPSGCYHYCKNCRKSNAAQARARRQSSAASAHRLGSSLPSSVYGLTTSASFPAANGSYYNDPPQTAQDASSDFSPVSTIARLSKVGA